MDGVHIITRANRHLYEDALEQSYRLRFHVYIEELKWRGLTRREDGRELDQFDTPAAVHLLYIEQGKVFGGTRLVPTLEPHLLSEVFPHFVTVGEVPRSPDIAEWTRFYVHPSRREEHKASRVGSLVLSSMIDYALEEGLFAVSALMNTFWLPRFLGYGWRVHPIGLPTVHDDEWLIPGTIDITHEALAGIRRKCGLEERSVLVQQGPYLPLIREKRDVSIVA
jgi:acyl-homoserine lactone synthase